MELFDIDDETTPTISIRDKLWLWLNAAQSRIPATNLMPATFTHIAQAYDDRHFIAAFGVSQYEFNAIHAALQLPDRVRTYVQDNVDSKTALVMLLAWLRGGTTVHLEACYGWSQSRISRVVRATSDLIWHRWVHLLEVTSTRHRLLSPRRLDYLAAAVQRRTNVKTIWGCVDGTVRPIAMPIKHQEAVYNGHKRQHALKWQFISTPDGLVFLSVPFDGNVHDARMWNGTGVNRWAAVHAKSEDGHQLYLYGDKGYTKGPGIIVPWKGNRVTSEQLHYNRTMSKYRITVEWSIGKISMLWSRFRDKQWQRTGLTPCGKDWMVGTLLYNAKTCISGNQISMHMGCNPPTLEEYFGSS